VLALQWPPLRGLYFRAVVWIDVAFAVLLGALAIALLIGG
jgi:hypothetical protein